MCEGIWRNRCGQRLVIIRCDPVDGQQWTDGLQHYSDDGTYCPNNRGQDLVVFVGPLPDKSQGDQTAKIELLRTTLTQQTAEIDRLRAEGAAAIDRLQAEWQTEFTAAQQLRSQVEQLEGLNCKLSEIARDLQEHHTAMDNRAEGARLAFLDVIKTLLEMRR